MILTLDSKATLWSWRVLWPWFLRQSTHTLPSGCVLAQPPSSIGNESTTSSIAAFSSFFPNGMYVCDLMPSWGRPTSAWDAFPCATIIRTRSFFKQTIWSDGTLPFSTFSWCQHRGGPFLVWPNSLVSPQVSRRAVGNTSWCNWVYDERWMKILPRLGNIHNLSETPRAVMNIANSRLSDECPWFKPRTGLVPWIASQRMDIIIIIPCDFLESIYGRPISVVFRLSFCVDCCGAGFWPLVGYVERTLIARLLSNTIRLPCAFMRTNSMTRGWCGVPSQFASISKFELALKTI